MFDISAAAAPFDTTDQPKKGLYPLVVKRGVDVTICLLLLPVALPLIGLLWLAVRVEGYPAIYGHRRVGRGGRIFTCWKIRTMVPDADARLDMLLATNPAAAQEWAVHGKLLKDPRVTRTGHFLRRSSLDELPQLWNVLRGDMSLVGPRPVTEAEMVHYEASRHAYLTMRPGLSGIWQVSGRNRVGYAQRVELDAAYARTVSLSLDLRILIRTLAVVLARTGA
jgi:lipopolysaccharide/colanic/teichoic acid biosynthesis glycosyltransferase